MLVAVFVVVVAAEGYDEHVDVFAVVAAADVLLQLAML